MCFEYQLKPCSNCFTPNAAVVPCAHAHSIDEICKNLTPGRNCSEVESCSELCYWCYKNKRAVLPKLHKRWNIGVVAAGITSVGAYVVGTGDSTLALILTSSAIAMHGVNLALLRSKITEINRVAPEGQDRMEVETTSS